MDKMMLLSQINLLDELPMEELKVFDQLSDMQPFKKGTLILSPDKPIEALFMLKKGQCRLYHMNEQGKQFSMDILVDGNVFGETSSLTLTDQDMYAEAMVDSYLCIMSKRKFDTFIEKNPKIALKLIEILSVRIREVYNMSQRIAMSTVQERILYLLLKLSEKSGKRSKEWQSIDLKLTHADIASMVGSTRETVSGFISQLTKEGVLKKRFRTLYVHVDKANLVLGQ